MTTIDDPIAEAQRWLLQQLQKARGAHRAFRVRVAQIADELINFGQGRGFIPVAPLEIARGFRKATVIVALYPDGNEETITASL